MRLLLVLSLGIAMLTLHAAEPTTTDDDERAPAAPSQEEQAEPEAAEANARDDSFQPTDQLRYDQEVDYPTDI